jgi:hypothetical protein
MRARRPAAGRQQHQQRIVAQPYIQPGGAGAAAAPNNARGGRFQTPLPFGAALRPPRLSGEDRPGSTDRSQLREPPPAATASSWLAATHPADCEQQ